MKKPVICCQINISSESTSDFVFGFCCFLLPVFQGHKDVPTFLYKYTNGDNISIGQFQSGGVQQCVMSGVKRNGIKVTV